VDPKIEIPSPLEQNDVVAGVVRELLTINGVIVIGIELLVNKHAPDAAILLK
jgi:hypothetical protein